MENRFVFLEKGEIFAQRHRDAEFEFEFEEDDDEIRNYRPQAISALSRTLPGKD